MFNKAAVIIGAGGCLGKKISEALIEKAIPLILIDKDPLIKNFVNISNKIKVFVINVEDREALNDALLEGTRELGHRIGYLIYAAGVMHYGNIMEESVEVYETVYRTNVLLPVIAAQCVVPYMQEEGFGHIIFISSVFSKIHVPRMSAYSMSKTALNTFMKIMVMENIQYNIKANCIAPGLMKGSFSKDYLDKMLKDQNFIDSFTRLSSPFVKQNDVVNMIIFLMESDSINGEIIYIDNGYSLL